MATTSKNFVSLASTPLTGSGYATNGVVLALSAADAAAIQGKSLGTILDKLSVDFSTAGYAKNGAILLSLASSTPVTVDFFDLTSVTVRAGDTSFGSWKDIVFRLITGSVTVGTVGLSNPLTTPLAGTNPTQSFPASSIHRWHNPAGVTIDATHRNLKFDPGGSAAVIAVSMGGA